ncbi:MAG TPA: hypothetical protein VHP83_12155 [Aggregatilineaceae bacterium]|nr:hypothetical protein [Aggregatilineaceae bacterium]
MTVKVEEMTKERIIYISIIAPLSFPVDVETPLSSTVAFKQAAGVPVCCIMDFTQSNLGFSDMIMGLALSQGKPGGFWDPDVYSIIVGTLDWVKFGIKAMQEQEQYKGARAEAIVGSREEALELAHSLLK